MAKETTHTPVAPQPKVITDAAAPEKGDLQKAPAELGADQIQKATDEAEARGYIGEKADPRPNSDYSMEGGAPSAK